MNYRIWAAALSGLGTWGLAACSSTGSRACSRVELGHAQSRAEPGTIMGFGVVGRWWRPQLTPAKWAYDSKGRSGNAAALFAGSLCVAARDLGDSARTLDSAAMSGAGVSFLIRVRRDGPKNPAKLLWECNTVQQHASERR